MLTTLSGIALFIMLVDELRWARTIRAIDTQGFAASLMAHPLAFAVICCFKSLR
jgi:hypothetical protein